MLVRKIDRRDFDTPMEHVLRLSFEYMCVHAEYTPSITKGMPEALAATQGEIFERFRMISSWPRQEVEVKYTVP